MDRLRVGFQLGITGAETGGPGGPENDPPLDPKPTLIDILRVRFVNETAGDVIL